MNMLTRVLGTLKVGHKVMWRGAFGSEPAKEATVESMELCPVHSKHGRDVKSVRWNTVKGYGRGQVVVILDNGHWAYGDALDKIETTTK